MMGIETIKALNAKAARKARNLKQKPVIVTEEQIERFKQGERPFSIPFIGDYRPRGFKLEREMFVDISGCGAEDEPALTMKQLANEMKAGMAYALIEHGQFQGYVAEFTPPKKRE